MYISMTNDDFSDKFASQSACRDNNKQCSANKINFGTTVAIDLMQNGKSFTIFPLSTLVKQSRLE